MTAAQRSVCRGEGQGEDAGENYWYDPERAAGGGEEACRSEEWFEIKCCEAAGSYGGEGDDWPGRNGSCGG